MTQNFPSCCSDTFQIEIKKFLTPNYEGAFSYKIPHGIFFLYICTDISEQGIIFNISFTTSVSIVVDFNGSFVYENPCKEACTAQAK